MAWQGNNNQGGGNGRLADYRSVAERIEHFWAEMRREGIAARIFSHEPLLVDDDKRIRFHAEVWVYLGGEWVMLANGRAEEIVGSSSAGGKLVENGETSAIGRALANAGYTTSKERASREEMDSYEAAKAMQVGPMPVAVEVSPEAVARAINNPTPIKRPKPTKAEVAEVFDDQAGIAQKVGVVTAAGKTTGATVEQATAKQATIAAPDGIIGGDLVIEPVGGEATRVFPNDKKEAARLAKMPPPFRAFIEKMWQYVEGDGEGFETIKERFGRAKPRMSEAEVNEARHQLRLLKTRIEEIEALAPEPGLAEDVATELADLTAEELAFMAAS